MNVHVFRTRDGGWRARATGGPQGAQHWYSARCTEPGQAAREAVQGWLRYYGPHGVLARTLPSGRLP